MGLWPSGSHSRVGVGSRVMLRGGNLQRGIWLRQGRGRHGVVSASLPWWQCVWHGLWAPWGWGPRRFPGAQPGGVSVPTSVRGRGGPQKRPSSLSAWSVPSWFLVGGGVPVSLELLL